MRTRTTQTKRLPAVLALAALTAVTTGPSLAHHSFAMYDRSTHYVFTGVVSSLNPDPSHLQIFFVPLNEARDALVIFYDPEVFVEPTRDIRFFTYTGEYGDYAPFTLSHCNQTIFLGADGRPTQVSPGTTIQYKVRDLYDRPWAQVWEEYFEDGMSRPDEDDSLGGFR